MTVFLLKKFVVGTEGVSHLFPTHLRTI